MKELAGLWKNHLFHVLASTPLPAWARALKGRRGPAAPGAPGEGPPDMPAGYYLDARLRDGAMPWLSGRLLGGVDGRAQARRRRENYRYLARALAGVAGLRLLAPEIPENASPYALPVCAARRQERVRRLAAAGVHACEHWGGGHRGFSWQGFPEAAALKEQVMTLPVNPELETGHLDYIRDQAAAFDA